MGAPCETGQAHELGGSDDVRQRPRPLVAQGLRGEPVLAVADREEAGQVAVVFFNLHVVDVALVGLTRDATQGHQVVVGTVARRRRIAAPSYQTTVCCAGACFTRRP